MEPFRNCVQIGQKSHPSGSGWDAFLVDSVEVSGKGLPGGVVTIKNKNKLWLSHNNVIRHNFCLYDKMTYMLRVKVADKWEAGTNSQVFIHISVTHISVTRISVTHIQGITKLCVDL